MDNDLGSSISRGGRSCIGRAVIDHQDIIELHKRAPDNIGNMFFFQISGNDRRDRLPSIVSSGGTAILADYRVEIRRVI